MQRLAQALSPDADGLISELTAGVSGSPPAQASQPPRSRRDPWWQRARSFPSDRAGHRRYDASTARELLGRILTITNPAQPYRGTIVITEDGELQWNTRAPHHPDGGIPLPDIATTITRALTRAQHPATHHKHT